MTVTGVGRVTVTPDRLQAQLRVASSATDVAEALSTLTSRNRAVLSAIAEHGVPSDDVSTTGLHVEERYRERRNEPRTYSASHRITVTLDDAQRFGELVSRLVEVGGEDLRVDDVHHLLPDQPALHRQARDEAFADARGRAEQLAALAGRRLGNVVSVLDRSVSGIGREAPRAAAFDSASESLQLEPGTASVAAAVTITWAWE